MSAVTPSRTVGSKTKGPRSGRAVPPQRTVAPLATASSTWAVTVSSWACEISEPMSTLQSWLAPSVSARVRETKSSTNRS